MPREPLRSGWGNFLEDDQGISSKTIKKFISNSENFTKDVTRSSSKKISEFSRDGSGNISKPIFWGDLLRRIVSCPENIQETSLKVHKTSVKKFRAFPQIFREIIVQSASLKKIREVPSKKFTKEKPRKFSVWKSSNVLEESRSETAHSDYLVLDSVW